MRFITRLIISALTLLLVARVVPGIEIHGLQAVLISALLLGFLNAIVRPILIVLTFPITILTLGIFIFFINASLFLFVASAVEGFEVDGIFVALIGSVLVSVVSSITHKLV